MWRTCDNVDRMSTMVQIRNVPDELHSELKVRAARAGMTLFGLSARRAAQSRRSSDDARVGTRDHAGWDSVPVSQSPAEVLREERDR